MQIAPEGSVQTQASAADDGAVGLPDGTNGGNDTNVNSGKKRGKLIGLLAAAAVLIAAVIGIGIYNAPSNRMSRALDLGARYLEEQNYEQALVEFDKVIAIDPMNTAAYLGKAQAYEGMGDTEQLLAVLQTGYEQTGDGQIKTELTDTYLEQASGYEESADYESALAVYDKLLELDGEDQKVQDSLSDLLLKQAADYAAAGDYDGALAVYDKLQELGGEDAHTDEQIKEGIVDAYLGKAQEYERMDDEEKVFETLQMGYEQTGDEQLKEELDRYAPIEWQDAAFESLIRLGFGKPEGEITERDVCDIEEIHIHEANIVATYICNTSSDERIRSLEDLRHFKSLRKLTIINNQISDISGLSELTNLKELCLNGNQISDISALSGLTNLETLHLEDNQISDISALSGLTNLKELWLNGNQISDISALSEVTNLETLVLRYNQISDISALSGLTNLESLCLDSNQISDVSALSGLTNLNVLFLWYNPISDYSPVSSLDCGVFYRT